MNFQEYYKKYLLLHQNRWNKLMHFIGVSVTIIYLVYVLFNQYWLLILLSPFIVYPFTFLAHKIFEKNSPAALKNPLYAKFANWRMWFDIILGRIKL